MYSEARVGGDVGKPGDPPMNLIHMWIRGQGQHETTESNKVTLKTDKDGRLETGAGNSGRTGTEQLAWNWCGPGNFNCLIKLYCLNKWFIKNFNYPQGQIQDIANFILTAMLNFDTRVVHSFLQAHNASKRLNFSATKWAQLAEA